MRRHWPLAAALGVFWATTVTLALAIRVRTGDFTYVVDDAYIHMAVARNLAQHGTWGVTPDVFASTSSSPLWTVILATAFLPGVAELTPLILALLSGSGLLVILHVSWLRVIPHDEPLWSNRRLAEAGLLVAVVFLAPMASVALTGMEHLLHAALAVAFVGLVAAQLARPRLPWSHPLSWLPVAIAPLAMMARYETMFLVGWAGLLLLIRRRPVRAAVLGVAAFLPVALYAAWSMSKGWFWAPSPILLKANESSINALFDPVVFVVSFYVKAIATPTRVVPLVILVLLTLALRQRRHPWWEPRQTAMVMFAGAALMHVQFARLGTIFRYDAYLVILAIWVLGLVALRLREAPNRRAVFAVAVAALILAAPSIERAAIGHPATVVAGGNIHDQQVQMAHFINAYDGEATVAINDIGAVAFFTDATILDTVGLATLDVAQARRAGTFDTQWLEDYADQHAVDFAIIYPQWLEPYGGVPSSWTHVGSWTVKDNIIASFDTVHFYAIRDSPTDLRTALEAFPLPANVELGDA